MKIHLGNKKQFTHNTGISEKSLSAAFEQCLTRAFEYRRSTPWAMKPNNLQRWFCIFIIHFHVFLVQICLLLYILRTCSILISGRLIHSPTHMKVMFRDKRTNKEAVPRLHPYKAADRARDVHGYRNSHRTSLTVEILRKMFWKLSTTLKYR